MSFWSFLTRPIKPWILVVIFVVLPVAAFGVLSVYGYVTRPNFEKLDYGMSMEEVAAIMGTPTFRSDSAKHSEWMYSGLQLHFRYGVLTSIPHKGGPKWSDEEKIAHWTDMIRLNPHDPTAYVMRGEVHEDAARASEITADLRKRARSEAISDADNARAKAIADYCEVIRLAPTDPDGYLHRGRVWEESHEWDRAITDYSEALRIAPTDINACLCRAGVLTKMGKVSAAQADYERAKELRARKP